MSPAPQLPGGHWQGCRGLSGLFVSLPGVSNSTAHAQPPCCNAGALRLSLLCIAPPHPGRLALAPCRHRDCISDEHYLPSLLAMYGLDNEVRALYLFVDDVAAFVDEGVESSAQHTSNIDWLLLLQPGRGRRGGKGHICMHCSCLWARVRFAHPTAAAAPAWCRRPAT